QLTKKRASGIMKLWGQAGSLSIALIAGASPSTERLTSWIALGVTQPPNSTVCQSWLRRKIFASTS
ncbi:hypothetical protein, partial [Phormidium sp. CCY1219]|uniref:hypothetical protein n=1 Tax=Phormidium sp. CCY1219 TaxID=2886104 RepID=UPI002D1EE361